MRNGQRLGAGVLLLVLVDVLWVASSEFTRYVFTDLEFDKPYFSTYFKSSLFVTYLLGFIFHRPWRDQCSADAGRVRETLRRHHTRYRRILQHDDSETEALSGNEDTEDDLGEGTSYGTYRRPFSSPTFVPVNPPDGSSSRGSGTEEDDIDDDVVVVEVAAGRSSSSWTGSSSSNATAGDPTATAAGALPDEASDGNLRKTVRFRELAEVVEMNPADAIAANLSRLSYNASLRAQRALRRAVSRLTVKEVAQLALAFTFPWFAGNYCYQKALSTSDAALVNVLSSASPIFTLVLSGLFPADPGDRFTLSKAVAVVFNVSGVALVSYSDVLAALAAAAAATKDPTKTLPTVLGDGGDGVGNVAVGDGKVGFPWGVLWTLAGSFFYSVYIVLLKRKVQNEENMDAPMFFGFVGVFTAALAWPGLLMVHFSGWEPLQMPSAKQWEFLAVNGLFGTVLSELLWILGCLYTSSLMATLAMGLTIPLSIAADIVWKQKHYDYVFLIGAVPMFCSFFIVAMLTHHEGWDPLMDLLRKLCCPSRRTTTTAGRRCGDPGPTADGGPSGQGPWAAAASSGLDGGSADRDQLIEVNDETEALLVVHHHHGAADGQGERRVVELQEIVNRVG